MLWLTIGTYCYSSFALNYNVFSFGMYLRRTMAENWLHGNKENWGNATKLTETVTWIPQWIHISSTYTQCVFSPAEHTRECDCWQESGKWTVNNKLKQRLFTGTESWICIQVRNAGDSRLCSPKQRQAQTVASLSAFWLSKHSLTWVQTPPYTVPWN